VASQRYMFSLGFVCTLGWSPVLDDAVNTSCSFPEPRDLDFRSGRMLLNIRM